MMVDVHMHKPQTNAKNFMDSLLAFWPGLQVVLHSCACCLIKCYFCFFCCYLCLLLTVAALEQCTKQNVTEWVNIRRTQRSCWKKLCLRALILLKTWRYISHLLTYLLTYLLAYFVIVSVVLVVVVDSNDNFSCKVSLAVCLHFGKSTPCPEKKVPLYFLP